MYCNQCGSRLAEGFSFCAECGAALPSAASRQPTAVNPADWETAEIHYEMIERGLISESGEFFVEAVGTAGPYIYLDGVFFRQPKRRPISDMPIELGPLVTTLVNRMTREGWVPLPRGEEWWRHRFQRPANGTAPPQPRDVDPANRERRLCRRCKFSMKAEESRCPACFMPRRTIAAQA